MFKNEILQKLGVLDVTAFDVGSVVLYEYNIYSAKVIGYIQYDSSRLTVSILMINSEDAQHGAMAFWRFYKKSQELAQIINAQELELLGIAVLNENIKTFLVKKGFKTREVIIPDELGNDGTEICYSKIIDISS